MTENSTPAISDEKAGAIYALAFELYQKGEFAKATTLFGGLVIAKKQEYRYWLGLGASHQMLKHFNKAIVAYKGAIATAPDHPMAYFHTAECLWQQEKAESARKMLRKAEKRAKKEPKQYESFLDQISLLKEGWAEDKHKPIIED